MESPKPKKLKFVDENECILEISETSIVFTPPLYRQRYQKVKEKIESFSQGAFSKVLDLGCSDLKFFRYLRDIPGVKEIIVLDKDEATLKDNIHHLKPMLGDFIMLRTDPLTVKAVCGDATIFNPVMKDAQVVTMIELIEHMYPPELPRLVDNVFRKLRPKVVIMTTPNADFNQYIPDFVPGTFRHWDHKFEWTGEEFKNWCHGIILETLDYSVEISGCGLGPNDTYCSQMAIFVRSTTDVEESLALALRNVTVDVKGSISLEPVVRGHYDIQDILVPRKKAQVISEVSYPVDSRTQEEKDQHFTLHKFHTLINYLKAGEDNQNSGLDWREDDKKQMIEGDHCDWSPVPMNGDNDDIKKQSEAVTFCCFNIDKEEEMQKCSSVRELAFYIVNQKYAIINMELLSTWVNMDSDREIPWNLIKSTVEEEFFDCKGDGENWQGKVLLCQDSSEDEDRQEEDEDTEVEQYKVWSEYDENHWACDTWGDVDGATVESKQVIEEEDWGWGESDASQGTDWGS